MKKRLKIYILHSSKIDYNNLLYKLILSSEICLKNDLILPYSTNYIDKYAKDLIKSSDIIIADTSKNSFGYKLELKWALATKKPIKFISITNKIAKGLNKSIKEVELFDDNKKLIDIIEKFVKQNAEIKKEEPKGAPIVIGEI